MPDKSPPLMGANVMELLLYSPVNWGGWRPFVRPPTPPMIHYHDGEVVGTTLAGSISEGAWS